MLTMYEKHFYLMI